MGVPGLVSVIDLPLAYQGKDLPPKVHREGVGKYIPKSTAGLVFLNGVATCAKPLPSWSVQSGVGRRRRLYCLQNRRNVKLFHPVVA